MLIPLLARRRVVNTSTTLYTGGDTTIDVDIRVDTTDGVLIFGRRDSNVLTGWMFGNDATEAYRLGAAFAQWGDASFEKTVSGLTIGTSGLNMTTAFQWNESAYPVEGYVVWSVGGTQADIISWNGTGGSPSAVSHGLGTTPGAALIYGSDGTVHFHGGRTSYTYTDGAWVNHGSPVLSYASGTVTPATGELFDVSPTLFTAVLFPAAGSQVASGEAAGGSAENIGWQPRTLFLLGHTSGEFGAWDSARDGTGLGDNSGDYSTQLQGSSAFDSTSNIQSLNTNGFTPTAGESYSYIAIR
ncbi:MAG: hypothetical protein ACPHCN_07220 [Mycobacterium sp.]